MNIKKLFIDVAKKHACVLIIGVLLAGVSMVTSMAIPFIIQSAIDDGIGKNNIELLKILSLILVAIAILGYIFEILNIYIFTKVSKEFTKSVFSKILKNLCLKKNNFFVDHNSGEINQRINEAWELEDIFSPDFFSSIYSLPMLIVAIIILINTSTEITIITLGGVVISVVFIGLSNSYIGKHMQVVLDKRVDVNSKIQEIILGVFEIRSNLSNKIFTDKADSSIAEKCKSSLRFTMGVTTLMRASNVFSTLLSIVLLYFSGNNIINGTMTIGTYFLIVAYVQKVTEPLMELTGLVAQIKPLIITAKRIEEKFEHNFNDIPDYEILNNINVSKISIKNISFAYPETSESIITNFNLTAKIGDTVLIKGANGSGKSTLLNLICGELRCDSGEILFDDVSENQQNCLSLARQHPFIFNLSLKENIILAEEFSEEKYQNILKVFKFNEYFESDILNNSVDIQENGKDLSGGQIKLIALARCMYRNRSIIILDEIISNLDSNLRKIVVDYIGQLKKEHILILVEHTSEFDYLANIVVNLS